MFELLKPTANMGPSSRQGQADTTLSADQLSLGEFCLLASAFASLLASLAVTAAIF